MATNCTVVIVLVAENGDNCSILFIVYLPKTEVRNGDYVAENGDYSV